MHAREFSQFAGIDRIRLWSRLPDQLHLVGVRYLDLEPTRRQLPLKPVPVECRFHHHAHRPGKNAVWGIDFVSDQLADGRRFRCLTVVDHGVHEAVAIVADHSLPATAVIGGLESAILQRGRPTRLSLDNGSEFRSVVFDAWAADRDIELHFIQPGKPIQNSHVESFNGRFRDECLNQHYFLSLQDARFYIERWRRAYNTDRPHAACYPLTPSEYAYTFTSPTSPTALRSA